MDFEQMIELIHTVSAEGLSSFTYEADGMKITMKGKKSPVVTVANANTVQGPASEAAKDGVQTMSLQENMEADKKVYSGKVVHSPLVGTFYASPSEDAKPYVAVGDTVKKGQVLAIVEAMKLMNEIESEYDGVITEILVENGEPVEYGQPLFCIG